MDEMKHILMRKYKFFKKAQALFFGIIFVSIMLLIFYGVISLFTKIVLIFMLLVVIFLAAITFQEAKDNKELLEEFMVFYTLNKTKNEKK